MNENFLYIIHLPGSILSIAGSIFVITLYVFIQPLRIYVFKIVVWISLFDLITSAILLIPPNSIEFPQKCNILGFFLYFSIISSEFWTLVIAISLYQILIFHIENPEKFYSFWLVFIFIFTVTVSVVPIFSSSYTIIYGIEVLLCLLLFIFYFRVYHKLNQNALITVEDEELNHKKLLIFPLIMGLSLIPIIIQKSLLILGTQNSYFYAFAEVAFSFRGFFNAVNYGLTRQVLGYLKYCGKTKAEIEDMELAE